jgi:hypothetical protein
MLTARKIEDGVILSPWAVVDEFVEIGAGALSNRFASLKRMSALAAVRFYDQA